MVTNTPCPTEGCEAQLEAIHYPRYIYLYCPTCGHSESRK